MHRYLFTLLVILLLGSISSYSQVSDLDLRQAAEGFIQSSFNQELRETTLTGEVIPLEDEDGDIYAYVATLAPKGFIVLSSEKGLSPVIFFTTESDFVDEVPSYDETSLLSILEMDMHNRLSFYHRDLEEGNLKVIEKNRKVWDNLTTADHREKDYNNPQYQYGPYCSVIWGGVNCVDNTGATVYVGNYYTPSHYSPGCVATSSSIVMHYYQWPPRGIGFHTNDDTQGSSTGSYYANFGGTTYDWGNMLNEYMNMPPTTTVEQQAMGLLAYHCGVAFDMEYENSGSTASTSASAGDMDEYFRYSGHYEAYNWANGFWDRVNENLQNMHPVTMAITDVDNTGHKHALACDGYGLDENDGKLYYHVMFGWWGTSDGWYALQTDWDGTGGGYDFVDGGVVDILPDPMMLDPVHTSEKVFSLPWIVSNQLTCDAFEIQESWNGGSWTVLDNNYMGQSYNRTVTQSGNYKYRVRAKVDGNFYTGSYSYPQEVLVPRDDNALVSLDLDGNDSFFVNDGDYEELDVSDNWTFETWVKIDNFHPSSDYDVIMDRRTVFSMYLISDVNADYAIRFVARDSGGNIIASLRSDGSGSNLNFDEWVHVAATRDGTTARLFINGVQVATSTDPDFNLTASTNALNFGARYWGAYSRYLVGEMDEIRISDVARYHQTGFTPDRTQLFTPDGNTLLLLHLDEGSGNSLGDASRHFFGTDLRNSPYLANWVVVDVLPVKYASPLSAKVEGESILLEWATATETNNKGFNIERSEDGKNWTNIAWVAGKATSNQLHNYRFVDSAPHSGINYYRLKQVDFDEKFEYSNIVTAVLENRGEVQLFPNPVTDWLTIKSREGVPVQEVHVLDYSGKEVNVEWGDNEELDISTLTPGVYFVKIKLFNEIVVRRFLVAG